MVNLSYRIIQTNTHTHRVRHAHDCQTDTLSQTHDRTENPMRSASNCIAIPPQIYVDFSCLQINISFGMPNRSNQLNWNLIIIMTFTKNCFGDSSFCLLVAVGMFRQRRATSWSSQNRNATKTFGMNVLTTIAPIARATGMHNDIWQMADTRAVWSVFDKAFQKRKSQLMPVDGIIRIWHEAQGGSHVYVARLSWPHELHV